MESRGDRSVSGRRIALGLVATFSLGASAGAQGYLIWSFDGAAAGDASGTSVAGPGDVDGDGVPDIAVGAPYADPGGIPDAGVIRVHSGANGSTIWTLAGSAPAAWLGFSVAAAGDVDGDGRADVLAGLPGASPAGVAAAGEARVYSGATAGVLVAFAGTSPAGGAGWSVASAGDVDGDNVPDPIVGAPGESVSGSFAAGRAYVVSGATGATVHTLQSPTAAGLEYLGYSVSGPGDVSGDGVRDLFVGVPGFSPATILLLGQAFVFSGLDGSVVHTFYGGALAEVFGYSVAGPGDADGDLVPDLLVGAPGGNPGGQPGLGYAKLYSGATGSLLFTVQGDAPLDLLGWSVAGAGDVNGDGLADCLAGSPLASPQLPERGSVKVFSGAGGTLLGVALGSGAFDELGFSVAGVGDVDADGFPDLLGGARFANPGGTLHAGQAQVFSLVGVPTGTTPVGAGCPGSGGFAPVAKTSGGIATPGNALFALTLARGLGGASSFLFFSPFLTPGGVPIVGCTLYLDLSFPIFGSGFATPLSGPPGVSGLGGTWRPMGIPPAPALLGTTVHFQWSVADPGSPNGAFVFSNALSVTLQ